jgi:hypothetical protein
VDINNNAPEIENATREMAKKWTKDEITALLNRNPKAVIHGLVAIYNNQTLDEKDDQATKHHNGIGFNGPDSRILSSIAEQYVSKKYISPKQMTLVTERIKKYAGQLTKIANGEIKGAAL